MPSAHDAPGDAPPADDPRSPATRPARAPDNPELETLTFHPRPEADGLVARLDDGLLVAPHPADADRITPGEAWACTLTRGPAGSTVARLVARVEPAPRASHDASQADAPTQGADGAGRAAGDEAPSHGPGATPGPGRLHPDERDQLERRRQELRQREEMLEAQLQEVRQRLLDLDEMLGR